MQGAHAGLIRFESSYFHLSMYKAINSLILNANIFFFFFDKYFKIVISFPSKVLD